MIICEIDVIDDESPKTSSFNGKADIMKETTLDVSTEIKKDVDTKLVLDDVNWYASKFGAMRIIEDELEPYRSTSE